MNIYKVPLLRCIALSTAFSANMPEITHFKKKKKTSLPQKSCHSKFTSISRGEVVIIGATNRLDAVDPALRRAGRFDRELHFPPPHAHARRDILDIYTKDWQPRPSEDTLDYLAQVTGGYGGEILSIYCYHTHSVLLTQWLTSR